MNPIAANAQTTIARALATTTGAVRREALVLLAPVVACLLAGNVAGARDRADDAMRAALADPDAGRGLAVEAVIRRVQDALTTPAARRAYAEWEAALIADMRAYLSAPAVGNLAPAAADDGVLALF